MKFELDDFSARHGLSPREKEVLELLTEKVVHFKDIAARLHLSPSTVSNHLKSIFEKTGTGSKTELLAAFLKQVAAKIDHCRELSRKPQVLVVDDEPGICEVIEENLSDRGMRVFSYTCPKKALEIVPSTRLDVVISDLRMPTMSGVDFLKEIRKTHHYTPAVVFISAYAQEQRLEKILDMGAVALIDKPIDIQKLFRVVMTQLIEDEPSRGRYVDTGEQVPTLVDEKLSLQIKSIGYGGVFIPLDSPVSKLSVGKLIAFQFLLNADTIHATGEITWKRDTQKGDLPAGIGVKFIKISEENRRKVQDYARLRHILSYIPIGRLTSPS